MKNLSFEKFLGEQYHPMNADSKELDYLLECIDGLNSDTQIREHLESLDANESLLEKKVTFKRKYGERPHIKAYAKAKVRNDILEFIDSVGIVDNAKMNEFFERVAEERGGNKPSKTWFNKNKHLVKVSESGGKKYYQLTKYGKRLLERVKKALGDSKVAEAAVAKLKKDVDRLDEASNAKMKKDIESTANTLRKQKYSVTIDHGYGTVAVINKDGDVVYTAQDEAYDNINTEMEKATDKFEVSEEDFILWHLDSAGAL